MQVPSRHRLVVPVLFAFALGLAPEPAAANPGFIVGLANRVRNYTNHRRRKDRKRRQRNLNQQVEVCIELMKSPFKDQRLKGLEQMLELTRKRKNARIRIQNPERVGVVLEQLIRDPDWKVRLAAEEARVNLELETPSEDKVERYNRLFAWPLSPDEQAPPGATVPSGRPIDVPEGEDLQDVVAPQPAYLIGDADPEKKADEAQ